jgi:anti-anti-sigma regulatory factor
MSAAISVLSVEPLRSSAALFGRFDRENQWFLEKHLSELEGDVVLDCTRLVALDSACLTTLRSYCDRATREARRVVLRSFPSAAWMALRAS